MGIHYAFFGNVVRGKSTLFRLVVRHGFAHFVWKVFASRKLLLESFGVFRLWEEEKKEEKINFLKYLRKRELFSIEEVQYILLT